MDFKRLASPRNLLIAGSAALVLCLIFVRNRAALAVLIALYLLVLFYVLPRLLRGGKRKKKSSKKKTFPRPDFGERGKIIEFPGKTGAKK